MKKSLLLLISTCSLCLLSACGGGSATQPAQPGPPHVVSVTVAPQFIFLTVSGSEQLSASATLSDGSSETPPSTCWSTTDATVVTIKPQGMASAVATGKASITCTDGGVTGSTTMTVQPAFSTSAFQSGSFYFLENTVGSDVVRLGMDTSLGGAVSEFSLNRSDVVAKASYGSHLFAIGLYDGDDTYDL